MANTHSKPYRIAVKLISEYETITGPVDQVLELVEDISNALDKAFTDGFDAGVANVAGELEFDSAAIQSDK